MQAVPGWDKKVPRNLKTLQQRLPLYDPWSDHSDGKGAHTTVCDLHTSASLVARSETLQGTDFEERATIFSKKWAPQAKIFAFLDLKNMISKGILHLSTQNFRLRRRGFIPGCQWYNMYNNT